MNRKTFTKIAIAFAVVAVSTLGIVSYAWFTTKTAVDTTFPGVIGLTNYFYQGSGKEADPYEIVFPIHLTNLSRLQSLGLFSAKNYFRFGHDFDNDGTYEVFVLDENGQIVYDGEGNPTYCRTIDMEGSPIAPIGSEGTPFHGVITGNDIVVDNLEVQTILDDVGVFGYCGNDSSVEDLVFSNLTINVHGFPDDGNLETMYGASVDDLFKNATGGIFKQTDLTFYRGSMDTATATSYPLKKPNGLGGRDFAGIDAEDQMFTGENGDLYYNGFFLPSLPSSGDFKFQFSTSLEGLEVDNENGRVLINMTKIAEDYGEDSIYRNLELPGRIYLTATYTYNRAIYTRVLQTYKVSFYNHGAALEPSVLGNGRFSMSINCDYVSDALSDYSDDTYAEGTYTEASTFNTNYHHGINVGFIVGHLDGSMTDCYVHKGTINWNSFQYNLEDSTTAVLASESQIGLIGEVGSATSGDLDPDIALTKDGDTGVMDFQGIYNQIKESATSATSPASTYDGYWSDVAGKSLISIETLRKRDSDAELYSQYLRRGPYVSSGSGKKRDVVVTYGTASSAVSQNKITPGSNYNKLNQIDFANNCLIEDDIEAGKDLNLGVFKIATTKSAYNVNDYPSNPTTAYESTVNDRYADQAGSCIIDYEDPFSEVYFSTYEYVYSSGTPDYTYAYGSSVFDQPRYEGLTTLPTTVDAMTFSEDYVRDFGAYFKFDLQDNDGTYYFKEWDCPWLIEYLQYKQRGTNGERITKKDPRFGLGMYDCHLENLTELSAYMNVQKPTTAYSPKNDGVYYPSNSVVFTIEANVANICIIARAGDYTDGINIIPFDKTSSTLRTSPDAEHPFYYLPLLRPGGNSKHDYMNYYTYDDVAGEVSVTANADSADKVVAHMFTLPKGDYYISSYTTESNKTPAARIYYLAVQGQTKGTIGGVPTKSIGTVEHIGFLLSLFSQGETEEQRNAKIVQLTFNGQFMNRVSSSLAIDVTDDGQLIDVQFNQGHGVVTYLRVYNANEYDVKPDYYFAINGVQQDTNNSLYNFE